MKTIIVTGGNGSIGAAVTEKLKNCGYDVVVTYFSNEEKAKKVCETTGAKYVFCDVKDEKSVKNAFDEVRKTHGGIYGLVNCAGIALKQKIFTETSNEEFEKLWQTNVAGTFNCVKEAVKDMIARKEGKIINISSVWGVYGGSCEVAYSATKGAINAMTKAMAKELGLSGITVNAVAPGLIDTDMNAHLSEEDKQGYYESLSVPRAGKAEEVAQAVLFLLENDYVTGQIVSVDGGM